ncbi:hypothetical protein BaRGS_00014662 [Batillaria attramentaria]|uniref:Glyoxylate reductase/hydroxypyruvate reductase n=1 Tax=Batillaria attramentaria TaxID=370345 RepID=A0ABD0L3R8_9CAEN
MSHKVYVTRIIQKPGPAALEAAGCTLTYWESADAIPREELIKNLKADTYDGLLCMLTDKIDGEVLDAAGPQLKVVSTMSVGYEHIDLEECKKRKITVTNTPNVSTDSVAELTVSLLLMTARRLKEGVRAVKAGKFTEWKPTWLCGAEITNRVVGIFGLGRIGYGVARRILPFGPKKMLYHDVVQVSFAADVGAEYRENLEDMLREVDFLCICCNLTPQTRHRINKNTLAKMKKTAIIVNSGRGGVIEHNDLCDALQNGVIAAAGLDVTEPEPLPKEHPLVALDNCVILPHMGSNTCDSRDNMSLTAGNNILNVLQSKKPMGLVA